MGEPTAIPPRREYVHGDLRLANVLVAGGHLAAVIDLESMVIGNGGSDLAHLLFEWHHLARVGGRVQAAEGGG